VVLELWGPILKVLKFLMFDRKRVPWGKDEKESVDLKKNLKFIANIQLKLINIKVTIYLLYKGPTTLF